MKINNTLERVEKQLNKEKENDSDMKNRKTQRITQIL